MIKDRLIILGMTLGLILINQSKSAEAKSVKECVWQKSLYTVVLETSQKTLLKDLEDMKIFNKGASICNVTSSNTMYIKVAVHDNISNANKVAQNINSTRTISNKVIVIKQD
jgi:hypothetical protein